MMMPDVSLRSLLDTYAEPAVLLSPDYEIIAANAAYAQWYGGEAKVVEKPAIPCHMVIGCRAIRKGSLAH